MENNNPSPGPEAENPQETIFSEDQFSLEGYDKHIRQARNAILAAAGLLLLSVILLTLTVPAGYEYLWIDYAIWGAFILGFVLLALWTKKKPYTAIVCALILYGILIALNAYLDPATIYKGIIVKVIIIVFLIKGLRDAKEAEQIKQHLGNRQ